MCSLRRELRKVIISVISIITAGQPERTESQPHKKDSDNLNITAAPFLHKS